MPGNSEPKTISLSHSICGILGLQGCEQQNLDNNAKVKNEKDSTSKEDHEQNQEGKSCVVGEL